MVDTGKFEKNDKTLVLCFDGTADQYSAANTNIVKLFSLLKKDDFNEQQCYYQAGIGTYFNTGVVSSLLHRGAKLLDEAIACYLDVHVMDGYKFLMQNYRAGDKICLFGFSRGAYTARALAGLLHKVGLLQRGNDAQVPFACRLYKRVDEEGIALCAGFKQTYCQDVIIQFMGVWDTVAGVGVIMNKTLPFVDSNTSIRTFRQALSLDEHRVRFRPNTYHRPSPSREAAEKDPEHASPFLVSAASRFISSKPGGSSSSGNDSENDSGHASSSDESAPERKYSIRQSTRIQPSHRAKVENDSKGQPLDDVLEVWFAGCHEDIGGGSVPNSTPHSLANISLRWMVREVVKSGCGIQFDPKALELAQIDIEGVEPGKEVKTPQSSLALDAVDAVEPIHDELKLKALWWILEVVPFMQAWQDGDGVWHQGFHWHLGRGRKIDQRKPVFHSSVKQRMETGYVPQAQWDKGSEQYVS